MAIYKDIKRLHHGHNSEFDAFTDPGKEAPMTGIYRCSCGIEITAVQLAPLPQDNHAHDPANGPIHWQLIVAAENVPIGY